MEFVTPSFTPALPEIFLVGMTCLILVVDLFLDDQRRHYTYLLALIAVAGTLLSTLAVAPSYAVKTFSGTFVLDQLAVVLKVAALVAVGTVFVYSRDYLSVRGVHKGEFYLLALFSTLGIMVLCSASHFLTLYLGLELMSLSLYAMVAFNKEAPQSAEAAMKYFVLGAIASGMLLYGMSILYGLTGSLVVDDVAASISAQGGSLGLSLAMTFIVAALVFKLGGVPFHMWLPDVYQGANTPVTLMVSSAPKVAAFAMFIRLLVEGLEGLQSDWRDLLIAVTLLSLLIGAVVAIAQDNIKRMLAYSTINHVGFLLLGLVAGTEQGYSAAMFYTLVYVLMALGAFGMVLLLSREGFEAENIDDFKGLNQRSPWFALVMLLIMFSMAGLPPTVGFYAKLLVLQAVVQQGMAWLAVLAVISAIVAAYYYLRVVKVMYFDEAAPAPAPTAPADMQALLSINGLAVLGLGIMPGGLMGLCLAVF